MNKKIIETKDIGIVHFVKYKTAKSLKIILKPGCPVKITIPEHVSFNSAKEFLNSKKYWIKENLVKIKQKEEEKKFYLTETTELKTKYHVLKIVKHPENSYKYRLKEGILEFFCPENIDIKSPIAQEAILWALTETLRHEAKKYLPERIKILSEKHGFEYKKLFIKNLKSKWGSCSSENNINLNLHLMKLPDELIDYVILHELAHTKEKNHGKNFWCLMNKLVLDAKKTDKDLKNYSVN